MKINNAAKVGIMVTIVIAILLVLTFKTGDFNFGKKGYFLEVHFFNVDGVAENAPVMVNGLEVGLVDNIQIKEIDNETRMVLTVWLEETARLREGASAYVKNMGFLGEKYVGLTSGNQGANYLTEGSVIVGEEAADFDKILIEGQEIAKHLKEVSENINERLKKNKDHIDNILSNFDTASVHIASLAQNLDERFKANETSVDEIVENMRRASLNLDEMTYDLKVNPWKLLYREQKKK